MISFTNKKYLGDHLTSIGINVHAENNDLICTSGHTDIEVQIAIDAYDCLPTVKAESKQQVKDASAKKRLQYITQAAGKDAEYKTKEAEAAQYEIDGSIGVFMQARMNKTGEGSAKVGVEWSAKATNWKAIGAEIAAIEDKAGMDIDACTDWVLCESIAKSAIDSFDLI
jgi:hypothetical protein